MPQSNTYLPHFIVVALYQLGFQPGASAISLMRGRIQSSSLLGESLRNPQMIIVLQMVLTVSGLKIGF
jgi:hypothetical protein